ncbi:MAG: RNA polymerase sigma-I factor [Alicyclobacillus sp.]|nr:RNA polymerase sigma-I factor [Alicyclobacillus sp.]
MIRRAQAGDRAARNAVVEQFAPFALRVASQVARRYIDRDRDDEYSVALLAVNEAIDRFDAQREVPFAGFAETVIRRRLVDYYRVQKAQAKATPWTDFEVVDDEDNVVNYAEVKTALDAHDLAQEQAERRQEIAEYARALAEFGLSFRELADLSPKHADARVNAFAVAQAVVADPELLRYVQERKSLPLKQLENRVKVSRKTMERQRKYILAVVVLLSGEFHHLQSYIATPKGG